MVYQYLTYLHIDYTGNSIFSSSQCCNLKNELGFRDKCFHLIQIEYNTMVHHQKMFFCENAHKYAKIPYKTWFGEFG